MSNKSKIPNSGNKAKINEGSKPTKREGFSEINNAKNVIKPGQIGYISKPKISSQEINNDSKK